MPLSTGSKEKDFAPFHPTENQGFCSFPPSGGWGEEGIVWGIVHPTRAANVKEEFCDTRVLASNSMVGML